MRYLEDHRQLSDAFVSKVQLCRRSQWVWRAEVLPALDFDIRDGVEVSGEVVLIDHCCSRGGSQQADSQVRDGEEVPQVLGGVQLPIKRSHVVEPRPGKQREAVLDLKAYSFVILPHITARVVLSADDVQQGMLSQVLHCFGLHGEGIQAVSGIELVGLPGSSVVQRLFQDHLFGSARLEGKDDVIGQFNRLVPRQSDVDQKGFGVLLPRWGLPESGGISAFDVKHELGRVGEFLRAGVTFIVTHVGVLLRGQTQNTRMYHKYRSRECTDACQHSESVF